MGKLRKLIPSINLKSNCLMCGCEIKTKLRYYPHVSRASGKTIIEFINTLNAVTCSEECFYKAYEMCFGNNEEEEYVEK